ncbi:MAG TPA: hypothetical protein VEI81_03530, partial [Methanoregula sp.]|nr:hypothetical protein [Methanoregula sp.]
MWASLLVSVVFGSFIWFQLPGRHGTPPILPFMGIVPDAAAIVLGISFFVIFWYLGYRRGGFGLINKNPV